MRVRAAGAEVGTRTPNATAAAAVQQNTTELAQTGEPGVFIVCPSSPPSDVRARVCVCCRERVHVAVVPE